MTLDRLDHLVLTVRDVQATTAFYGDVLGLEAVRFGRGRLALRFGDQKLNLHQAGQEIDPRAARPTPGSADLCFLTSEPLAFWLARLRAAGVAVEEGPVMRTGALGPIESLYLRDPDGNLLEIARQVDLDQDPLEPLRLWLAEWQECVRTQDFPGGRALCAPDLLAFGTRAEAVQGLDAVEEQQWRPVWPRIRDFTVDIAGARGAVEGTRAWVAARWDSRGQRPDGTTFRRPGRLTVAFERREGRWLAVHTHFSLSPDPA